MTNENQALSDFWKVAYRILYGYALHRAYGRRQEAEEGVSDAICSYAERIARWWIDTPEEHGSISAETLPERLPWLYQRIKDRVTSALRKHGRHQLPEGPSDCLEKLPAPSPAEASIHSEALQKALAGLPASDRQILHWVFVDELTDTEIGEKLGLSQNAVTVRKRRALNKLRRLMP